MLFRVIAAVASVAFISQGALAALTPQQIVDNVDIVSQVSQDANNALARLSPSTPPAQIRTIAQDLADKFNIIINDIGGDITAMQATTPFPDCPAAAGLIVPSLRNFVRIHQALLSTVIGKHGILAQFGVTQPIAAVLSSLEAIIDSFAGSMINLISCATSDVTQDKDQLDQSVGNTIDLYKQFCLPSVLYPKVQPICIAIPISL